MDREEMINAEDYDTLLKEMETNSPYKRLPSPAKKWMSVSEMAEMLELTDGVVYDLIKRNNIEVVIVDYWKRVPKKAFRKWYDGQSRYRTKEDKKKDAHGTALIFPKKQLRRIGHIFS